MRSKILNVIMFSILGILVVGSVGCAVYFVVPKEHEHNYQWVTTQEATCTETGTQIYKCTICGDIADERTLPTIPHDYQWIVTKEASCSEMGKEEYKCTMCGDQQGEKDIQKTPHDYHEKIVDSTCTQEGYKRTICSHCQHEDTTKFQTIPKKQHDYQEIILETPTCTKEGKREWKCSMCHQKDPSKTDEDEIIEKKPHQFELKTITEATCQHPGSQGYRCAVCGIPDPDQSDQPIEQLAHDWDDGVIDPAPTCTKSGRKTFKCRLCKTATRTEDVEPLGHLFNEEWEVERPATTEQEGILAHKCKRCNAWSDEKKYTPKLDITTKIYYSVRLKRSDGDNFPVVKVDDNKSVIPQIIIKDKQGTDVFNEETTNASVQLLPNQNYQVYVENLPEGYHLKEKSYLLTPEQPNLEITVEASLRELPSTVGHTWYYGVGTVVFDDKMTIVGDGNSVDYETSIGELLKTYKGIFLNFYFKDCFYCRQEMPNFLQMFNTKSSTGQNYSDEIAIIMINDTRDKPETIRQLKKNGFGIDGPTPFMMADNDTFGKYMYNFYRKMIPGFPTSIYLDCEGVIVGTGVGGFSTQKIKTVFENLIDRYNKIRGKEDMDTETQNIAKIDYYFDMRKKKVA